MLVRLIAIETEMRGGTSKLKEVYLNPQHIISVTDDSRANETLISEALTLGLDSNVSFSRVTVQEGSVPRVLTIVGTPQEIYQRVKKKQILRG
tara:strand:- start:231 stop:509 length:279 start_codon:yes stop_codon:yes gene_type:complete